MSQGGIFVAVVKSAKDGWQSDLPAIPQIHSESLGTVLKGGVCRIMLFSGAAEQIIDDTLKGRSS
jgi:hypothetical protein